MIIIYEAQEPHKYKITIKIIVPYTIGIPELSPLELADNANQQKILLEIL